MAKINVFIECRNLDWLLINWGIGGDPPEPKKEGGGSRSDGGERTVTVMLIAQMLTIQIILTTLVTLAAGVEKPSEMQPPGLWRQKYL